MKNGLRIVAFGANSAICQALLRHYAGEGASFFLTARSWEKLAAVAADLSVRGAKIQGQCSYDFKDVERHGEVLSQAREALGSVDLVIVAHGTLPDTQACEASSAAVQSCMENNFLSTAVIVQCCSKLLEQQGEGTLAVLSSVAGDRGRASNYFYGAAKSGIDTLLQGLSLRFYSSKVNIVNVKPGLIRTPMTADMTADGAGPLWSTPQAIAPRIVRAIASGKAVVYVPGYWRYIMWVIRLLPTAILARLNL